MGKMIRIHERDNVAVALETVEAGENVVIGDVTVCAGELIPQGHKMALKDIVAEESVIKYGFPIGHVTRDVHAGEWLHTHNVRTNLVGEIEYQYEPQDVSLKPQKESCFMGFLRKDGRAAVRNEIWIIPTVGCVNGVAGTLAKENQDLVRGNVEGIYAFFHPFGCSQTGADHAQTRKLLAALANHPNAGAV